MSLVILNGFVPGPTGRFRGSGCRCPNTGPRHPHGAIQPIGLADGLEASCPVGHLEPIRGLCGGAKGSVSMPKASNYCPDALGTVGRRRSMAGGSEPRDQDRFTMRWGRAVIVHKAL